MDGAASAGRSSARAVGPPLPPGRYVDLPRRGRTFVRELPGPVGAMTIVLLHGWTAGADLNWFPSFAPLGQRYRIVSLDHRGHGRGIRSRRPFRLESCADDVAALADVLGIERFVPVGYSMGGPIAQLTWQRHRDRVAGLVLCATSATFAGSTEERLRFASLGGIALASRLTPASARRRLAARVMARPERDMEAWAFDEIHRNDWTAVLEAGRALGRFTSTNWVGDIDVPTAVVMTTKDHVVPPRRQLRLAEAIAGATLHPVEGDHDVCVMGHQIFVPALVAACESVQERVKRHTE